VSRDPMTGKWKKNDTRSSGWGGRDLWEKRKPCWGASQRRQGNGFLWQKTKKWAGGFRGKEGGSEVVLKRNYFFGKGGVSVFWQRSWKWDGVEGNIGGKTTNSKSMANPLGEGEGNTGLHGGGGYQHTAGSR